MGPVIQITAAASRLPGWEDGWTQSGMSLQQGAGVYPCCMPEKKKQKNMYIKRAEANIACVTSHVCVREVSCWSLISI